VTDRPDGSFHVVEHSSRWTGKVSNLHLRTYEATQNRDARAIHLKLDEIIKSIDQAQNESELTTRHVFGLELLPMAGHKELPPSTHHFGRGKEAVLNPPYHTPSKEILFAREP
jgi:hypothetical protein